MKKLTTILFLLICTYGLYAQDSTKTTRVSADLGVDLYNRYIWRGVVFSDAPNIQPWLSVSFGGFTALAWGSYATNQAYEEVDLFLSYTIHGLTIGLNDYFTPRYGADQYDFTNYRRKSTVHLIEGSLTYELPIEAFPLSIVGSTFLYGADRNDEFENRYSSYIELSYPFKISSIDFKTFIGGQVNGEYYNSEPNIVNLGISASKSLVITEKYSLPVTGALIVNPSDDGLYFTIGMSF